MDRSLRSGFLREEWRGQTPPGATRRQEKKGPSIERPFHIQASRDAVDQRSPIGLTERGAAPENSWRGRPILYSGSAIISLSWAIQPTVRASAKMAVNRLTGMPIARCTLPGQK